MTGTIFTQTRFYKALTLKQPLGPNPVATAPLRRQPSEAPAGPCSQAGWLVSLPQERFCLPFLKSWWILVLKVQYTLKSSLCSPRLWVIPPRRAFCRTQEYFWMGRERGGFFPCGAQLASCTAWYSLVHCLKNQISWSSFCNEKFLTSALSYQNRRGGMTVDLMVPRINIFLPGTPSNGRFEEASMH